MGAAGPALGWPKKRIGFADVLRLARAPRGWGSVGRPEFGRFKYVHTNPDVSTSGLEAVSAEYAEVLDEVDAFVRATEGTARRAQLLHEGLEDNPPEAIARRVGELGADHPELREALTHQLAVQRRMEKQLGRFYDEMDRLAVELDTIRGEMLTASAAEGSASQREAAAEVRALRERMGAVSEGMAAAYEEEPAAGPS